MNLIGSAVVSKRPRVAILGSCVTRDAFAVRQDLLDPPVAYFARTSLISAVSTRPVPGIDTSTIASSFQRRMVEQDVRGGLIRFAASGAFDLLVCDLIDERFQVLFDSSGRCVTRSREFTLAKSEMRIARRVEPHSEDHFRSWEIAWRELVGVLNGAGRLNALRINRAFWAESDSEGNPLGGTEEVERTARANAHLLRMYARIENDLDSSQIYRFDPSVFVSDVQHRWGVAPYHYARSYYSELAERIVR
ncbi:DUF6270 domain-containing protein [Oerskovia sp. USHLN155]|uniref:DUF6270 domain-containing protein n=1 Tax=Oerskovia sp. USHLN155 TaxID=3081288 RepID=UPI0030189100